MRGKRTNDYGKDIVENVSERSEVVASYLDCIDIITCQKRLVSAFCGQAPTSFQDRPSFEVHDVGMAGVAAIDRGR